MSETTKAITDQHLRYLAAHTAPEDDFLASLRRGATSAGLPAIAIAAAQGSLMQILLRLARARVVIEVGTLGGYSAIWMARALPPDGHVHTVEVEPRHADFAAAWIAKSDVAERITLHRGAARDVLPTFSAGSADAAFLDADKENYTLYLGECLRILRPGGLVMADNAFAFGELFDASSQRRDVKAMRDFNDHIARHPQLQSIIVPLGDGLWVGVVTR
jgi:predicted O-methyltransferase YrrM